MFRDSVTPFWWSQERSGELFWRSYRTIHPPAIFIGAFRSFTSLVNGPLVPASHRGWSSTDCWDWYGTEIRLFSVKAWLCECAMASAWSWKMFEGGMWECCVVHSSKLKVSWSTFSVTDGNHLFYWDSLLVSILETNTEVHFTITDKRKNCVCGNIRCNRIPISTTTDYYYYRIGD